MADPTAIFSAAEARAFSAELADTGRYSDAAILATEVRIRSEFEQICGVALIPTTTTEILDGVYREWIRVSRHNPFKENPPRSLTVSAATIDGVALSVPQLADLVCYADGRIVRKTLGYWYGAYPNLGNVSIVYKHGYAAVPTEIVYAALTLAAAQLVASDISERATSYSDGVMTYQLTYAGAAPHWYGIPDVDAILDRRRESRVGIA